MKVNALFLNSYLYSLEGNLASVSPHIDTPVKREIMGMPIIVTYCSAGFTIRFLIYYKKFTSNKRYIFIFSVLD